jgi:hypothetical protein
MIRRIAALVAFAVLAVLTFWSPREAMVAADAPGTLPPGVLFRADHSEAAPPFVERWVLTFQDVPAAQQSLTLQIGALAGENAPGRLTAAPGQPWALLERMALVLGAQPGGDSAVAPVSGLDVKLDLLADSQSAGRGEVGAVVIAGAFVSEPEGPWRVYRMTFGAEGPSCFLAISAVDRTAVLLPRAVEDGPAIMTHVRALLTRPPATS